MKKNTICVALFLVLCSVFFVFLSPIASAGLDYSVPGQTGNVTLTAADILTRVMGFTLTDTERVYLERYCDTVLRYDDRISTRYVSVYYHEEDKTLTVYAESYEYVSSDGMTVVWTPDSFTLSGETVAAEESEGGYTATFENVSESPELTVTAGYRTTLTIPRSVANRLLNLAYNDAAEWESEIARREEEYRVCEAEYRSALSEYENYLDARSRYLAEYEIYSVYLAAKAEYDERLADYNAYLSDMEEYSADMIRYREYLSALEKYNTDYSVYLAYLSEMKTYESALTKYNSYLSALETARHQLAGFELVYLPMTDGRTLYDAVMGSTVDSVIENKSAFTAAPFYADPAVIDAAGESTTILRELMTEYRSITNEEQKYHFYTTNYDLLRTSFTKLLRSLDTLYSGKIRGSIISDGKDRKYRILLAQLILTVNALTDGEVRDSSGARIYNMSWTVDSVTVREILENKSYYTDNGSAAPLSDGYPTPVGEPTKPETVEKPTAPTPVNEPIAPEPVEKPEEPEAVKEPEEPPFVSDPGDPPEPYVPDTVVTSLISARKSGEISPRDELAADAHYAAVTSLIKSVFGAKEVTVRFFSHDGTEIYRTTLDSGTYAGFSGDLPKKADDARGSYTFSRWVDEDGNPADLSAVWQDMKLYPEFDIEYNYYDIGWTADGKRTVVSVKWGDMPTCPVPPEKAPEGSYCYTFTGFAPEPEPVTGAREYTAVFSVGYLIPLSSGGAEITQDAASYTVDCTQTGDREVDLSGFFRIWDGTRQLVLKLRDCTLTLRPSELRRVAEEGTPRIRVSVSASQTGRKRYVLSVLDADGGVCDIALKTTLSVPEDTDLPELRLSVPDGDGGRSYVKFSKDGERVSFQATSGAEYSFNAEYPVNVIPGDLVGISVALRYAYPGEPVPVSVQVPDGTKLLYMSVIRPDGRETVFTGGSFIMPESAVSIAATAVKQEYMIVFMSDGRVLKRQVLCYGDMPTAPESPKKIADGEYTYTFAGWSEEVRPVTGDMIYAAVYTGIPIEREPEPAIVLSDRLKRLFLTAIAVGGVSVFGLIPSGVILIFGTRKRKRLSSDRKNGVPRD